MDETTGQIEQHIYREREHLGQNIDELQSKVKNAVDWRMRVREHPLTMLGVAFGVGVVASMFIDGHRESRYGSASSSSGIRRRVRREWNIVKAAVGAAILAEARDFVREMFPRFGREYEKRERAASSGRFDWEWASAAEPGAEEL